MSNFQKLYQQWLGWLVRQFPPLLNARNGVLATVGILIALMLITPVTPLEAHVAYESLPHATVVIDGVTVTLQSPLLPRPQFSAPLPDQASQQAIMTTISPYREVSIMAIPLGTISEFDGIAATTSGGAAAYRRSLEKVRAAEHAQLLQGPIATIFGQHLRADAMIVELPLHGTKYEPAVVIEWVALAGERIWTARIVVEEAYAESHSGGVQGFASSMEHVTLTSTSLNAPSTLLQAQHTETAQKHTYTHHQTYTPSANTAQLPFPTWWSGNCDVGNDTVSYPLGDSYLGMPACGPRPTWDSCGTYCDYPEYFFPGAVKNSEWECVELVSRYMYLAYGIDPYVANGGQVVSNYPGALLTKVPNNGAQAPVPGDVMSFNNSNANGHTALVVASSVTNGNGTIDILQQNFGGNGYGNSNDLIPLTVSGGVVQDIYGMHATGWLHAGSATPTGLRGDFNGDGKADMAAAYNYGNATTGIWVWTGASGLGSHVEAWKSAAGAWDATKTKWVVGDFNGDGKADLAAIRDDGNDAISIWIWTGTSSSTYLTGPVEAWSCSSNCWSWNNSAPTVGDFNGDGKADLAIAYNYGSATTGIWVWPGIASSPYLGVRSKVWESATGGWDWTKTKWATGDFNGDGKADIAGVYDYGSGTTAIEVWPGASSGYLAAPTQVWKCGPSCWTWANSTPIAGDFNGDGKTDLAMIYDYGSGTTGIWVWQGMSSGYLGNQSNVWQCGPNCWTDSHTKWASGDYNGDGFDDLMGMYDYGSGTTGIWVWSGAASSELTGRSEPWQCGPNCWTWANNNIAEAQ